jgi:HEAT repeat protein
VVAERDRLLSKKTPSSVKITACRTLGELGREGKGASRVLCWTLNDANEKIRLAAVDALQKVNPTIAELAITIMVDNNGSRRFDAVRKVTELGADGNAAVPALLHFMSQQGGHRPMVVKALAAVAHDEKEITKLFVNWLARETDPSLLLAVVEALPRMEDGRMGIPTLAAVVQTYPREQVQIAAIKALADFGSEAKDAAAVLRAKGLDQSSQVRAAAQEALEKITAK